VARSHTDRLPPVAVHLETPSVARVEDYYLGGSTNWAVDREFAHQVLDQYPLMRHIALIHREFLNRVVRHLVNNGIRQFLDVGSGIPDNRSTHQVADAFAREGQLPLDARVIYVDNDPIAVGQAELILRDSGDPRRHVVLEADLRDPVRLWRRVDEVGLFDLSQPVALLLIGVLHLHQPDIDGNEIGAKSTRLLFKQLPPGSFAAVSHVTYDGVPMHVSTALRGIKELCADAGCRIVCRSRHDVSALLDGLQMLDPGWTAATAWHPEAQPPGFGITLPPSSQQLVWAGVGRKLGP
jgi:S-adenosyl methyltransferase